MITSNVNGGIFLTMCALLIMTALPAYADDSIGGANTGWRAAVGPETQESREKLPVKVVQVKMGEKSIGMVDYYGDGRLMVIVPVHLSQKKEAALPEVIGNLIRTPADSKLPVAEQIGEKIIIRYVSPAHE